MMGAAAALLDHMMTIFVVIGAALSITTFFVLLLRGRITMEKMRNWIFPW
ncbi:MAG: hypothetical protein ACRCTD_16590 [Beijerinckiaceae bacterium]